MDEIKATIDNENDINNDDDADDDDDGYNDDEGNDLVSFCFIWSVAVSRGWSRYHLIIHHPTSHGY